MKLTNRIVIAVLLVTLAGTAAFGKTRKKSVTLTENVTVNGTLVKAGSYEVAYDEVAMELSISKNGKLVVKTAAHTEARARKAPDTQVRRRMVGVSPNCSVSHSAEAKMTWSSDKEACRQAAQTDNTRSSQHAPRG